MKKTKEPIKIRFKELANGKSIYLDINYNGKRAKKYLKMYLSNGKDLNTKISNNEILRIAEQIKIEELKKLYSNEYDIKTTPKNMYLYEWISICIDRETKDNYKRLFNGMFNILKSYTENIKLKSVDINFCLGFILFMKSYKSKRGGYLKENTIASYFVKFNTLFEIAIREGYLKSNPCKEIDKKQRPKSKDVKRDYLTKEELFSMINTKCENEQVKRAFLLSCFCGLRVSDIISLKWCEIIREKGKIRVYKKMKKTNTYINLILNENAQKTLPKKTNNEYVFDLPTNITINHHIKEWSKRANIEKHITFHTARHTFATLLLTNDVNIAVISNLLGHKNLKTTMIYTDVINESKESAIKSLDNLF